MASNLRVDSIVPATGSSVSIGTATGGVNIPGVLTYEDVTNVDSVGVITARSGIRLGATGANSIINGNADGIGINTAAASSLGLEIASPFNDIARMTGPNSGNITFRNATANEVILHTGNSDALIFGTNGNNERIRIGTAGQIGIAGANYGTSGQVLTSQGASSAVAWSTISAGTEVYDTWIYTAETNVYAAGNYLTSNWSRFGDNIGSAITQSSGVFSFPSTGFYRVTFTCNFFERNSPDNIAYIYIQITTNNSSYTTRVASLQNITDRSGDTYTTCHAHCLFDVTNTTTHKVRFFAASDDSGDLRIAGAPTYQQVYATFQKLGNT